MNDQQRIDELEAQLALVKSVLGQLIEEIRVSAIDLERNYDGDILDARADWSKADLYEMKKSLN